MHLYLHVFKCKHENFECNGICRCNLKIIFKGSLFSLKFLTHTSHLKDLLGINIILNFINV